MILFRIRLCGLVVVLFGTDSPWCDQAEAVAWIQDLPLSSTDHERIFYRNARDLLC